MSNVAGDGLFDVGGDGVMSNLRYSDPTRSGVSTGFTPLPQIGYVKKALTAIGHLAWVYLRRLVSRRTTT